MIKKTLRLAQGKKITKNMLLAEIVDKYPNLGETLAVDYGFHCIGCYASEMETLEQGAMVHGMNKREIDKLVVTLNEVAEGKKKSNSK
jgi:hybrid cluster-associated redox disulfide protein